MCPVKLLFKFLIFGTFFCTPMLAEITHYSIEGNLAPKINPGCITMSESVASLNPADLALGILECHKNDDIVKALDMFWVMKFRAFFDSKRVNDESAGAALGMLQTELFRITGEKFFNKMQNLLDQDSETFFNRLCTTMKALGPPVYYPEYMILHGMNAFLGIEGDGLKPDFKINIEWNKILKNELNCKKEN